MLSQRAKQYLESNDAFSQLVVACGVGLLLGLASLVLSPLWALGVLVGGFLLLSVLKRPELALLGILVATSSMVFEGTLPLIPIGIGSLHIPDAFLLVSFCLIVLRRLVEQDFKIIRTPLDLPLLAFYGMAVLSTLIGVLRASVEVRAAVRAIRIPTYYLTFFIVTNLVREDRQLRLLLRGFFLLAILVAAAMVAQFLLGESASLVPGRVETLSTQGRQYAGVTRILPPGLSLVLVTFVATTTTLVLDRFRLTGVPRLVQWGLLGLAVVVTFLRSYWSTIGVVLGLFAFLVRGKDRQRLIVLCLVIMLLAAMASLLTFDEPESGAGRLMGASLARLGTLGGSKTLRESSLQWRYVENEYALKQIKSHPFVGLGLGARYRPRDPRLDWEDPTGESFDGRAFLHNGHLWIMTKMGLLGYICLMWLSLRFLIRGFGSWRRISDSWLRGIFLGFTLAYLAVLIGAVVNSTFMQWYWTPVIGIMMGTNEVVLRKAIGERSVS